MGAGEVTDMKQTRTRALFATFFKIGAFTFGGGYAMVALLEHEFVEEKQWVTREEFLDMVAIAESTPGPMAVNSATYIGYKLEGVPGAAASTLAVCLPSFAVIYAISLFFDQFLQLSVVSSAFRGIQVCVVYLVLSAGLKMLKNLKKDAFSRAVLAAVLLAMVSCSVLAVSFSSIFYILLSGAAGLAVYGVQQLPEGGGCKMICLTLFWNFLMIGTLSFGGGYGMISLVREVVLGHGWLTESEFLSFIAVSESTPGPLAVNMATFIGSSQAGLPGALVATLGVVLPSFVIILLVAAVLRSVLRYAGVQAVLDGVRPCVVAMILATAVTMGLSTLGGYTAGPAGGFAPHGRAIAVFVLLGLVHCGYKKIRQKAPSPIGMILLSAVLGIVFWH